LCSNWQPCLPFLKEELLILGDSAVVMAIPGHADAMDESNIPSFDTFSAGFDTSQAVWLTLIALNRVSNGTFVDSIQISTVSEIKMPATKAV
jgi:hypothetical protein